MIIGRFQTFHNGHRDMIDKAIALCDSVGVFIGSSQEHGTEKNPFTYELREELLSRIYGGRILICPLPDIGVGNNPHWGDHVIETAVARFGKTPDLLISGKEERRIDWFDSVKGLSVAELYVPKSTDISATEMRSFFVSGDRAEWEEYTPRELWGYYDRLREDVLASIGNVGTDSI